MDFEKAKKNLKNDMLVLFILELIILAYYVISQTGSLFSIAFVILLLIGYLAAKNGEKKAGTIGIIVGILMVLTILIGDVVDFILGIFVLTHSVKYNNAFIDQDNQ